ncbi:MAG TPA: hypothetical protein DHV96_08375 [Lachnospiraceae bacterium]|nr:hypothetical protein [Lachnospiraceae bacterium]
MTIKVSKKRTLLFVAFFLVTLSNSSYLTNIGKNSIIEYIGLFALLLGIYHKANFKSKRFYSQFLLMLVVMFFFCIGLIMQQMNQGTKVNLIISMLILASIAMFPNRFITSIESYRTIGDAISLACFCALIIALINGVSVLTGASTGFVVDFGFNGGMAHRNYFSYTLLASILSLTYFNLFQRKKNRMNKVIILELILLILTNSKGAYLVTIVFGFFFYRDKISAFRKRQRVLSNILIAIVAIAGGSFLFFYWFNNVETFHFRINGLINYWNTFSNDKFHLLFGNAAMAFRTTTPGFSYDENIRSVIGWDGSTELVLLNILVKNGLLGLIGYIIIFVCYFRGLKWAQNKDFFNGLMGAFLLSALVESYLANINMTFTVFCYTMLASNLLLGKKVYENNHVLSPTISRNLRKQRMVGKGIY